MSELERPLKEGLRKPFDADEVAEVGARVLTLENARMAGPPQDGGNKWLSAASVAAIALLGVFAWRFVTLPDAPIAKTPGAQPTLEPLRLVTGGLPETLHSKGQQEPARYAFVDGSRFKLEADTQLVATLNDGKDIRFDMRQGTVDVYVKPGGSVRWTLHTELADVQVVGTRFSVARLPDAVTVQVQQGTVVVLSPHLAGNQRSVSAGESLTVTRPVPEGPDRTIEQAPVPATKSEAARGKKAWRVLAKKQRFGEAYEQLGGDGVARETAKARTVNELFDLADVARLSGHPGDAVEPLQYLVHRFPHDSRAGVAAFTLGNLLMAQLNKPREAAMSFERAIAIGVPAELRETTYVRAIQTRRRAGDDGAARRLIATYLAQFPKGHHTDEVRAWAEELK